MLSETSGEGAGPLRQQIEALQGQLSVFGGYRSVWVDDGGQLWHAEPEDLLEAEGFRYLGSFMHPSIDELWTACCAAFPARAA